MGQRIVDKACFYLQRENTRRLRRLLRKHRYLQSGASGLELLESTWGHLGMLQWLLEHGVDVNASDGDRHTTLMSAAAVGDLDRLVVLVDHGADVNVKKQPGGETPFSYTCAYNQLDAAKLLYERGAEINATDSYGGTPLDTALCHASQEFREWLLSIGAERGLDFEPWPAPTNEEGSER